MTKFENPTFPNHIEVGLYHDLNRLLNFDSIDNQQVMQAGTLLETSVHTAIEEGVGDNLTARYTPQQIAYLRNLHSLYEVAIDARNMDSILNDSIATPNAYPFQAIYDRIGFGEGSAAGLSKGDRVLHIGSGWPGTTIGLYRQFGIPVTCVEIDSIVADKSRRALDKLGLLGPDKLQVVHADGKHIDPQKFKAVIVAAMVPTEDKRAIVRNMRDLAVDYQASPLLVLRTPVDNIRSLFYQPLPLDLSHETGFTGIKPLTNTSRFLHNTDPLLSIVYKIKPMPAISRGEDRQILAAHARLKPAA